MIDAATLDALTKAANATAYVREPRMRRAIAPLAEYHGMTILAAQAAKIAGLRRPLISPEVHANLVKVSGVSAIADQLRGSFRTSGVYDQMAEQWRGQLQAIIDRSGIGDRLTATMREGLADLYTPSWSWDVPAPTVEKLRSLDHDALGSVIEVVADELEDGPADAADWSPVALIQNSAGKVAIGWAFVQAYCAPPGPPDISPDLQQQITLIVAGWALFGVMLPGMLWLASRVFPD